MNEEDFENRLGEMSSDGVGVWMRSTVYMQQLTIALVELGVPGETLKQAHDTAMEKSVAVMDAMSKLAKVMREGG